MQISRLPQPLVRREHGMLKDHVIVIEESGAQPLALRVNAAFAGYLAGMMSELSESPEAVARLEARLQQRSGTDGLMPESQTLFRDLLRTVRRRQSQAVS